jgi:hypothetical protein
LLPIQLSWLLPIGFAGFAFAGTVPRKRRIQALALFILVIVGMSAVSCGGNTFATQNAVAPVSSVAVPVARIVRVPSHYAITIQGNYSSTQLLTTVNVTVQ